MVSNRTLAKVAAYTGILATSGMMYMNWKIQKSLKDSPYFQEALKLLRLNRAVVHLMGEPISHGQINLHNPKNFCDSYKAQFEVPVKGPKDSGSLYLWARRATTHQKWDLYRLELALDSDTSKRLAIIREQSTEMNRSSGEEN